MTHLKSKAVPTDVVEATASIIKRKSVETAQSDLTARKLDPRAETKGNGQSVASGKRSAKKRRAPDLAGSKNSPAAGDLEVEALRSGLERAGKQINSLTQDVKRFETTVQARTRELSALRTTIMRLKDDKLQLERRVGELVRDSEALRVADRRKASQIGSLVRSTNRLNNEMFWSVCHFIAGSNDFESYAKSVDYDLTRLFTMLLAAEIREASDLSPDIQTHATLISDIFDPFFYLTEYQDVALDGVNPLLHYVTEGYREKRRPTLLFDSNYYADRARLRTGDPLFHYVGKGVTAGLKPHPLFDTAFYLEHNPDVAASGVNPLFHYQTWGGRERRNPSPLFDTEYYLELRNLGSVIGNPLQEYLSDVSDKSIDPHPLFHSHYFCEQAGLTNLEEAPFVIYEKRPDLNQSIRPHPLFDLGFMQNRVGISFPEGISPLEAFCRMSRERDIEFVDFLRL